MYVLTGRDPNHPNSLPNLIARYGDSVWDGGDSGTNDRGDRYSHKPTNPQPRRKQPPGRNDT